MPAHSAREVGERTARLVRDLSDENQRLRDKLRGRDVLEAGPPPAIDDPGYQVWSALMEDLRADGVVRMRVKTRTTFEIHYEAVSA